MAIVPPFCVQRKGSRCLVKIDPVIQKLDKVRYKCIEAMQTPINTTTTNSNNNGNKNATAVVSWERMIPNGREHANFNLTTYLQAGMLCKLA